MDIQVIHTDGEEWGISFNGPNPEPKDYFTMPSKDEAFRLRERIANSLPVHPWAKHHTKDDETMFEEPNTTRCSFNEFWEGEDDEYWESYLPQTNKKHERKRTN